VRNWFQSLLSNSTCPATPWPEMESSWGAIFAISRSTTGPLVPEVASTLARNFIQRCFQYEAADMPTASQLLQHAFVAGTDAAVSEAKEFVKNETLDL
jgi:serine/threonine protein kinase